MPSPATLDAFIAMVESGAHDRAIATFYTPDSTMQENTEPPRRGRDANVAREAAFMARAAAIHSTLVHAPCVSADRDHVVLHWLFRFDFADGTSIAIDELAHQRWEGELIAEERFFYDPAQRARRTPTPLPNN